MAKPPRISAPARFQSPAGAKSLTLAQAQARTAEAPDDAFAWRELGRNLLNGLKLPEAHAALEKSIGLKPDDPLTWAILGHVEVQSDNDAAAQKIFRHALQLDDKTAEAHFGMAGVMLRLNNVHGALTHVERAQELGLRHVGTMSMHAVVLTRLARYAKATEILKLLIERDAANRYSHLINLANIQREIGQLAEAEANYLKASALAPKHPIPLANRLTLLHYMPEKSAEDILQASREWGAMLALDKRAERPRPSDLSPSRKLRIGMFSDGFRQHPVGAMTTTALEQLVKFGFELYMYTTTPAVDAVTRRLMAIAAKWTPIAKMSEENFAQRIRDDKIDILMDLAGHNNGTRLQAITLEPAPLLVKWVGGLINTTAIEAIDYLITDGIESPPGTDEFYTEKLIRMPDDYICYMPPAVVPAVGPLPALKNGYITFGCFNNPTKINEVLLTEWAKLMHAVPDSRLLLKSGPYESPEMQSYVLGILGREGIAPERVRFDGQSGHLELFQRYNEVDIALDPWPYSGGLTTCEALLMGVPVVTLPGPTFAGRHSATHLINVGMPELVAKDWNEYRARAQELASDLQSLSTIRQHLRQILLGSVVCDSAKFARHLADALRAIWQRYCNGKPPAAMAFTPEGQPWFEDEDGPTQVTHPAPEPEVLASSDGAGEFNFAFQGKIIALDHGGTLVGTHMLHGPSKMGALTAVVLDPASRLRDIEKLKFDKHLHHYHPHIALGDGEPGVLYTCLQAEWSGTLEPLAPAKQLSFMRQPTSVLAKLPIPTTRLDGIDGLDKLDWLILNETNDNKKILQGAEGLMNGLLVVHVRLLLIDVFKKQPDFSAISKLLAKHGLRLLRLDRHRYGSYFSAQDKVKPHRGSQQIGADAIFVPDEARIKTMESNQLLKLAFILHTCYGAPDLAYQILGRADEETSQRYLKASGWLAAAKAPAAGAPSEARRPPQGALQAPEGKKVFVHICYNNMHTQKLLALAASGDLDREFAHQIFVEQHRSIPGYDNDLSNCPNASFFNYRTDLPRIVEAIKAPGVAGVFMHGMFYDWQKLLVKEVGAHKKVIWIMWGGDLYGPIRNGAPIYDTVRHLHAVATDTDGDYRLFCDTYGEKPRLYFPYPADIDFVSVPVPARKSKTIFVGNSGDPGNLHGEILECLAKKADISEYKIILPLSYNLVPEYADKLKALLARLKLEAQASMIMEYMPSKEYYALLAGAEIMIMAHQRQQAFSNLSASLYFGNKTILRKNISLSQAETTVNPLWNHLTQDIGTQPIDYADFSKCARLSDLATLSEVDLETQRQNILKYYDKSARIDMLQKQFIMAAEF